MANEDKKVGYTWYPNDWKGSDTFLDVDDPLVRYYYREILDLLYLNGGRWEENKARFEKAQRVTITVNQWTQIRNLFNLISDDENRLFFTHKSVTNRLDKRSVTSAENGAKGGRPKADEKPKNNLTENLIKPNKPVKVKEDKIKEDKRTPERGDSLSVSKGTGDKPRIASPSPLWALGTSDRSDWQKVWEHYGKELRKLLPGLKRDQRERAWFYFLPVSVTDEKAKAQCDQAIADMTDSQLERGLSELAKNLVEASKSDDRTSTPYQTAMQARTQILLNRHKP